MSYFFYNFPVLILHNGEKPLTKKEGYYMNTTEVGSRIRSKRKEVKMNQKTFATSLGISQPEVSNIEKGKRVMTTEKVAKIASVLGCDANWLATGTTSTGTNTAGATGAA
jgi:DNA-binding XRE family transcriptional regulator